MNKKFGWGIPNESVSKTVDHEKRAYDAIGDVMPSRLMRRSAKSTRNESLLAEIHENMGKAGYDSGFSFSFLFHKIIGKARDWPAQLIGSCVGSGDRSTTVDRMLAEIFLLNDAEDLPGHTMDARENLAFFTPFSYRAGRSIAGINGGGSRNDGSLCLPHIEGKMKYGHLRCNVSGLSSDAYPEPQDMGDYRRWGADDGLLNKFKDQACCKLVESERVQSASLAKELLEEHFKPMNICSDWAFKSTGKVVGNDPTGKPIYLWTRDRRDSWAHNMQVLGSVECAKGDFIETGNQWAGYHDGHPNFMVSKDEFNDWVGDRGTVCQSLGEFDLHDSEPAWPGQ